MGRNAPITHGCISVRPTQVSLHNQLYQALNGRQGNAHIERLMLTGSGMPEQKVRALELHVHARRGVCYRDIKMTLRYAHLAPSHLRAGIQALEQRSAELAGGKYCGSRFS